jgi:hypothetical protein
MIYLRTMASNTTQVCSVAVDGFQAFASSLHVSPATLIGLLSSFAGLGVVSCLAILPYLFRVCRGQDVVTQCLIGKSILTISYDVTGNGIHAAKKLVVDLNHGGKMKVEDTGQSDSPPGEVVNPLSVSHVLSPSSVDAGLAKDSSKRPSAAFASSVDTQ